MAWRITDVASRISVSACTRMDRNVSNARLTGGITAKELALPVLKTRLANFRAPSFCSKSRQRSWMERCCIH